jgi:hypothetical protein
LYTGKERRDMGFLLELFNHVGVFGKMTMLVGFIPVGFAVRYALWPTERTLAVMRPVSLAAIFAGISGVSVGTIAVLQGVAATVDAVSEHPMSNVLLGLSEAVGAAFVNFGLLSVAWLLVAAGMLRRPV